MQQNFGDNPNAMSINAMSLLFNAMSLLFNVLRYKFFRLKQMYMVCVFKNCTFAL